MVYPGRYSANGTYFKPMLLPAHDDEIVLGGSP